MPETIIIDQLKRHYAIDIHSITTVSGGADMNALAYKADSQSHSYFVKLKYGYFNDINMSIIHLLHDAQIKEIIFPVSTTKGQLFHQLHDCKLFVYPFINAANGFTRHLSKKQWIQFGQTLRRIHETPVPSSIQEELRKEIYSTQWRQLVRSFYSQIEPEQSDDDITTEFKSCFRERIDLIHQLVNSAEELSQTIQPDTDSYILCHSDIHAGNLLVVNDESIYIIDWDEPMLAPKERDLMFIGGGVGNVWNKSHEINYFYEGYGKTSINKTILSYYRHERIVEDMAIYGQDLLSRDKDDKNRLESLNYFKSMFETNDVVDIALGLNLS